MAVTMFRYLILVDQFLYIKIQSNAIDAIVLPYFQHLKQK